MCFLNVGIYNIMIVFYGRFCMFEEVRNMFEFVKEGKGIDSRFIFVDLRLSLIVYIYEFMLGVCVVCEYWDYFEVVL